MYLNKEDIWLGKKEFFKFFATQTDRSTVLNFTTWRVEKLRTFETELRIFEN